MAHYSQDSFVRDEGKGNEQLSSPPGSSSSSLQEVSFFADLNNADSMFHSPTHTLSHDIALTFDDPFPLALPCPSRRSCVLAVERRLQQLNVGAPLCRPQLQLQPASTSPSVVTLTTPSTFSLFGHVGAAVTPPSEFLP